MQAFQDHETVTNVIDAVVTGTEVFRSRQNEERDGAEVTRVTDCGWTCGCAGKTARSLENTCHTWALLRWSSTKRRYIKCTYLYLLHIFYKPPFTYVSFKSKSHVFPQSFSSAFISSDRWQERPVQESCTSHCQRFFSTWSNLWQNRPGIGVNNSLKL